MDVSHTLFDQITGLDNLLLSWFEFRKGKRQKPDVQEFERHLEDNLFKLHWELKNEYYRHLPYQSFLIFDPKLRKIHKATVRDRVVHHAVFRVLYPLFDPSLIYDSYSCRINKGTHKAVNRLEYFLRKGSHTFHSPYYVLKCDIRKFFASVDHEILKNLLNRRITDFKVRALISRIIDSYSEEIAKPQSIARPRGLPIGNLTSQLFANVYMHALDNFMKHKLKIKSYLRYTDDFAVVHTDPDWLQSLIPKVNNFLQTDLRLELHPKKIILKKLGHGADFLGYVILPYHRVLRTKSKHRMFRKLEGKRQLYVAGIMDRKSLRQSVDSYFGVLKHCHSRNLKAHVKRIVNSDAIF